MKRALAILTCLSLAACANEPISAGQVPLSQSPDADCELVYMTGSSLPKKVCRTAEQRAELQRAGQEIKENMTMEQTIDKPDVAAGK